MTCPTCGAANEPGRKFCGECGTPLAIACPSCGTANAPTVKFCGECGTALTSGAPAPSPPPASVPEAPAPAAERRLVTVLFADLVGFTSRSEGRDAEETRELLSRYFDTCRRLIELYGGTVEKFIGDAVMAVWGAPIATEDDAERAVRAALDLVTAVSALGDEAGEAELRARAGVLTGEAAVTIGAQGEGMVAGDLVNTASRIQSLAPPGSVYVGDSTRRATDDTIAYEDAGSHELQGKTGLYPLFRALRVVSGARGSLKSQGLEAPFVGRDRELRLIKDLYHGCADDSRAHLVSVIGFAGIGKSRLAWEFFKYIDGLPQVTYWHRGRCLSYGEGVTYWALADMVRMRCRIAEDEAGAPALAKLDDVLEEHVADDEERRFVRGRVAHLLGLEDSARFERDDLFAAWRVFFERLAEVEPVSMVFEDMQWADDSLLDFIDYLLESARDSRLFVLTLARPELNENRPTWGAGRRNFTSLYLEPLAPVAMEALLSGLVPGLPEEIRTQILERAEGVPLYAVETVRMLLDRGALVQEGAVYQPTGPIHSLEVPETLHALVAARLDALSADERRLLQDAAVLGKAFTKRSLATLSGVEEVDLDVLLAALARKEVLAVQNDPRSPEHGQYSFLQDILRHVAYETISKRERRVRHLAAAEYLRSAVPEDDEIVEVLAAHYLDAYNALPDAEDAEETKTQAREMLARAGDRAASLAAAREAQRYFEQAAALVNDPVERADLQQRAGQMAWRRGRGEEARALLEEALATFEAEALVRPAARVSAALGEIELTEGRTGEGIARLEKVLETLSSEERNAELAEVAEKFARFLYLSGRRDDVLPRVEVALELAEALALPAVFVNALTTKALVLMGVDRLDEARILLDGAVARALAEDLPRDAARALNNMSVVLEGADRYADASEMVNAAVEQARRAGDRVWEVILRTGQLSSLVMLGQWDEALEQGRGFEGSEAIQVAGGLLTSLVAIYCSRGEFEEARAKLERDADLRDGGDLQYKVGYRVHEAMVLRGEGKPRVALETLQPALDARPELGIRFLLIKLALIEALECAFELGDTAKVEELLGVIDALRPGERPPLLAAHAARSRARLTERPAEAEREFAQATDLFRDLQLIFWVAVTQLEHAEWLVAQNRGAEAEPLVVEARQTFEQLAARPWVERAAGVDARRGVEALT